MKDFKDFADNMASTVEESQHKNDNNDSGDNYILGSILIVSGIVLIVWMGMEILRFVDSYRWATTPGTVSRSYIQQNENDGESGAVYSVIIRYDYTVDERRYNSDGRLFGFDSYISFFRPAANFLVSRYPEDRAVTVYYNSDDPQDSVIERRLGLWVMLFFAFGVGIGIGGVVMVFNTARDQMQAKFSNKDTASALHE